MTVRQDASSLVWHDTGLLTDEDLYLFNEGTHARLYEKMGARPGRVGDTVGTHFAVWAPNAEAVSVIGDFNGWSRGSHPLQPRGSSGVWQGFIPGLEPGVVYKYHIASRYNGYRVDKGDPFAAFAELPPRTASVIWDWQYEWGDAAWMRDRAKHNAL